MLVIVIIFVIALLMETLWLRRFNFFVRNFCVCCTEVANKEIMPLIDALRLIRVREKRGMILSMGGQRV